MGAESVELLTRVPLFAELSGAELQQIGSVAIPRPLRDTNARVARQSFQTVPSRVAGVPSQLIAEEAIPEERSGITVRMTQADLAQLAGTSRESVSRFLATLERAGVVSVGRGRVTVLEPRRLRAYIF
jgi:CRP/FNR family transcriptional regulator